MSIDYEIGERDTTPTHTATPARITSQTELTLSPATDEGISNFCKLKLGFNGDNFDT